jgi:hypothetical protein
LSLDDELVPFETLEANTEAEERVDGAFSDDVDDMDEISKF